MPERRVLRQHKPSLPSQRSEHTTGEDARRRQPSADAYSEWCQNGGAPGVDGVMVTELQTYLKKQFLSCSNGT